MVDDSSRKIEVYIDGMMNYLVNDGEAQLPDSDELERYINLFSFFMYNNDPDYLYNLPFLREQHRRFRNFLDIAPQKYSALANLATKLLADPVVRRLIEDPAHSNSKIILTINDFLCIDIRMPDRIYFHERFSVPGAVCSSKKDRFTIIFGNSVYSWQSSEKNTEEAVVRIDELIRKWFYEREEQ